MEPFKVTPSLAKITDHYPDAESVLGAARTGGEQAKVALARLWLSEGIPFAFRDCPGLYESIRTWLSSHLSVEAKQISLIGSARLGSSLSPNKLNKKFDSASDLDIFVVSEALFGKLSADFSSWSHGFDSGAIKPRNDREARFWQENNQRLPHLIQRGFIDSKLVPNVHCCEWVRRVNNSMWLIIQKLRITEGAPKAAKASLRCYNSWDAYIRQTILSLTS